MKKEFLNTYFCLAVNFDDHQNILEAVTRAGLDNQRAQEILNGSEFTNEVLEEKATYTKAGISSVPTIILNDQYLLQGAQPSESFVEAFEQLIQKS